VNRQDALPGFEDQPSLFGPEDRDLLDAIAAQATEEDYRATAELLRAARQKS
jgi:hypothetical protein